MNINEYTTGGGTYLKPAETEEFDTVISSVLADTDFNGNNCVTLEVEEGKLQLKWYQVKELKELFGDESDEWVGKSIHVGLDEVKTKEGTFPKFTYSAGESDVATEPIEVNTPVEVNAPPVADIKGGTDSLPF